MGLNDYFLGITRYQVIAPCVVAQFTSGQEAYVYRGGLLPSITSPAQIQHLLDSGMIRALEAVAS